MPSEEYYKKYQNMINSLFSKLAIFLADMNNANLRLNYRKECSFIRGEEGLVLDLKIEHHLVGKKYEMNIRGSYQNKIPRPEEFIYKIDFPKKSNSDKRLKEFVMKNVEDITDFL